MLKPRQVVTVLTLSLIAGSLFFVFSPEVARSQNITPQPRGLEVVGTALMEASESPLAGVSVHGNLAFVGGLAEGYTYPYPNLGVRIVDLSDPSNPELVGRIPLRSRSFGYPYGIGDAVATHIATEAFQGDIAIVLNGVPETFSVVEYPQPYGVWDVTDPRNPKFLSIFDVGYQPSRGGNPGMDLGDKPRDSKAVAGNYFYTLYKDNPTDDRRHVAVVDLSDPLSPAVVGDWTDDIDVGMLGLTVNERGTRAYITGVWPPPYGFSARDGYVYVLDIQDPSLPTEIGRYIFPLRGVPSSMPKAAPNSDDSLLIVADMSGQKGRCGILTILDISDLAAIHETSTFSVRESNNWDCSAATDVAISGNLVSSTWIGDGLRLTDISDPRRPVQVGEFHPIGKDFLSDVALKDDLVIATKVWDSGLFVLRPTAERPTIVIDETKSLRVSAHDSAVPGFHVSWSWPDGTRETAWDGFLNVERNAPSPPRGNVSDIDYPIGKDGWVYVQTFHPSSGFSEHPWPAAEVDVTVTGVYSWGETTFVMEADPAHVIFDRVGIFLTTMTTAVPVGETAGILVMATYDYDNSPFEGTVTLSENLTQAEAGTYSYTVVSIEDTAYGVTVFDTNTVEVTFYVPLPFYAQQSFYLIVLLLGASLIAAGFLWRRRRRRQRGAKARVDRVRS